MSLNEPLYATDIESRLDLLSQQLEEETERFAVLVVEKAEAEAEYKRAYHKAVLTSTEGTVAMKEARAFSKSAQEYREYKITEALEKATQQKLMMLRSQIDSARTISANIRNQT